MDLASAFSVNNVFYNLNLQSTFKHKFFDYGNLVFVEDFFKRGRTFEGGSSGVGHNGNLNFILKPHIPILKF